MEGETYGSISKIDESEILPYINIEFLHGKRTEEGIFKVVIVRRITRTKYLAKDVSGNGILNLERIPSEVSARLIKKNRVEETPRLLVVGRLLSEEKQECPVLLAETVCAFSYEQALELLSSE
ncbi:uncharacterized protein NEMAJ01_0366 [Nematocida major]|uniref:uncharacterized protein n=1 Tax=Nematocida major TaxID=1912982 RepID=UPI0020080386|nr:uncharacterized protein NEMAJ01_0366 [Nematocida major]KAH9385470.1 hypothetical protein NEMAJ01_0366 [Nematocida major]